MHDLIGLGLMLAVELERPCKELLKTALEQGLLINIASDKIIRLLPPLIISDRKSIPGSGSRIEDVGAGFVREPAFFAFVARSSKTP